MNEEVTLAGKCVRCNEPIYHDEHGCLDGAMDGEIVGGYGSRNDLCSFKVFICDDFAHAVSPVMKSELCQCEHKSLSRAEYLAMLAELYDEDGNPR